MKCQLDFCRLQWISREFLPSEYVFKRISTKSRFNSFFTSIARSNSISSSDTTSSQEAILNSSWRLIIENQETLACLRSKKAILTETIDISKILSNEEKRKSLMIKNIPNKYTIQYFMNILNSKFHGTYDLFLLPTDKQEKKNFGYAFINFIHPYHVLYFYSFLQGKKWPNTNSLKTCDLVYSKYQGEKKMIKHTLANSKHWNVQKVEVTNISEGESDSDVIIPNAYVKEFLSFHPNSSYIASIDYILVQATELKKQNK